MARKVNIPNQTNLSSIIAAQINDTTNIVDIVINAVVNSAIKYSSSVVNQLKSYNEVVKSLFNNNEGTIITLIEIANIFKKYNAAKTNKDSIKNGFDIIQIMQSNIKDLLLNINDLKDIPNIDLSNVKTIIKDINVLREDIDKDHRNTRPLWFKFWLLKLEINKTINFISDLSKIKLDKDKIASTKELVLNIKNVYKEISEITEYFENINNKTLKSLDKKMSIIKTTINNIIEYFNTYDIKSINKINKIFSKDGITLMLNNIVSIIENISKTYRRFIIVNIFKKLIINAINAISDIVNTIIEKFENIKAHKTIIKTLENIKEIVDKIVIISKHIIFLGLISAPALLAAILITFMFIPAIALTIISIATLSKLILRIKPGVDSGIKSLVSIIASLLLIGASLIGFALLTTIFLAAMKWGILVFVEAALIMSLIMWGAFKIIGKLSENTIPSILAFGLVVMILIATMIGVGLTIILASKMAEYINESIGKITLIIVGMLALTAVMILLGIGVAALSPYITISIMGFAQILAVVGLIIGIGAAINLLAEKEVKTDEAVKTTNKIILTINDIRKELTNFGTKREWRQDKRVLKQVNKTVKIITKIADNLNKLQTITINKDTIISNVTDILQFTQTLEDLMHKLIFGSTINDYEDTNSSNTGNWLTRNIGSLFHKGAARRISKEMKANKRVLSKVDRVINKLLSIGGALVSIGELKITEDFKTTINDNIANIFEFIGTINDKINTFLKMPELNSEGKPLTNEDILDEKKLRNKSWRKNKRVFNKVEATIVKIQSIADVINTLKDFKFVEGENGTTAIIKSNVEILMNSIEEIANIINGNTDNVSIKPKDIEKLQPLITYINELNNGISSLATSDSSNIKNNVDNYIRLIDKLSNSESTNFGNITKDLSNFNNSINEIGKSNEKQFSNAINNYIKFVDKINTVEVKKLETSAKMFEQMAKFSNSIKGNFEKLAETLAEDLMPVLQELKEIMGQVPEKLDSGFQNTSASIAATTTAPTSANITAQVNRENPNLSKDEVDNIVKTRLNERAKMDANGTIAKLDELLSLLKGYSGENVIVQTV